jgi:hypothetical protein
VDKDLRKGDRRSDGRIMTDFFTGVEGQRLRKQWIRYDPSHEGVRLCSNKRNRVEEGKLLNGLAEVVGIKNENDGISIDKEQRSSSKENERAQCAGLDNERVQPKSMIVQAPDEVIVLDTSAANFCSGFRSYLSATNPG